MLHSLATRMVASTVWRHASSGPVSAGSCRQLVCDVSFLPKRSKDAAFTGNQDGCLHSVAARFQRASERGILPPVKILTNYETG
jgi:hypothetical protein